MIRKAFSKRDLAKRLQSFGSRCSECLCSINGSSGLEWDHHVPLAIGGPDDLVNLEPLCIRCHRLKTRLDVRRIAKVERVRQKHLGIRRASRFPGSRSSPWKKKLDGSIVRR